MTTSATQKNTLIRALIIFLALLSPIKAWSQAIEITSLDQITTSDVHYIITQDISGGTPGVSTFSGTLEAAIDTNTHMPYRITGLNAPLFETLTGTVKNLVLDEVAISDHSGNTGAIACTANDAARIYNVGILGGSVGGTGNTGGLVGLLDGTARVVNCYSYATITGGTNVGGIVGNNNYASKASDIRTMVMNCMFYGDITGGNTVSPVYGGKNINNLNSGGLTTFNYYAYDELQTKAISSEKYNCALAVEERNLVRHEFYRLLLNSNKKLAAFYATGSVANGGQMLKWVLETADRSIANPKPYPILKAQGYYPSIINPDISSTMDDSATVGPKKGGRLGSKTLAVTILKKSQKTDGGQTWPVSDTSDVQTTSLTLVRTDMDSARYNYNYDKVQLPYYNDVGTGNYTEGRVVTGWKITAIDGGTPGSYSASDTWGGYNFADRNCTNKDLYSVSGRVFAQGAYYDVPYGVTAITIEPYWGQAAFLADPNYDAVFNASYGRQEVTQLGTQVGNSTTFNGLSVKTSINDAFGTITTKGPTVYDNAIVLVGNFHQSIIEGKEPFKSGIQPFTLMSVDLDNDHEPDYSLIYHDKARSRTCPIRFDFLNMPGTAQAQKPNATATVLNASVFNPMGWFEITNTCLIYFSQFEYENSGKTQPAPVILLGGVFDQFTSTKVNEVKNTPYLHVGGNAWFKNFGNGTHSDGKKSTKHIPISVTGGDYQGFYLTGTYNQSADKLDDNAECYISGGHFGEAAGAGQEQIGGDVRWQIYNADIDNFYGGGVNSAKPILGHVTVDIVGSHVRTYCGGPKFGDMAANKVVTTNASWCTFGTFFGAGFGGTSYSRVKYYDESTVKFNDWQTQYTTNDRGKYFNGTSTNANGGHADYGKKGPGVAVDIDYEFFVWTTGTTGGRFFIKFADFSLAMCRNVFSNLKHCTVEGNFYGGGSLGSVDDTTTSVLDSCQVLGNVFGAGYSASLPTLQVRDAGFVTVPALNKYSGMFEPGKLSTTTECTWITFDSAGVTKSNGGSGSDLTTNHNVYTSTPLDTLGSVRHVNLTLQGTTVVGTETSPGILKAGTGNVFGGGEESAVGGNTTITLQGKTQVLGDVFGGGENGTIDHNTTVTLQGNAHVKGDVFGGGDRGPVKGNASVILK